MSDRERLIVVIERRDGSVEREEFDSERAARAFCEEEVKWESTRFVSCQALNLILRGDFA